MDELEDSEEKYMTLLRQYMTWRALKDSITGLVKKVDATNIKEVIPELFSENLIRGRELFCRACIIMQKLSPGSSDVYAALVAVVNAKFPEVGAFLLQMVLWGVQIAYKTSHKDLLLVYAKFTAHLVNQQVADKLVALELLTLLLKNPSDDRVEVAVDFLTECGSKLQHLCPLRLHGIFERFREILDEGDIDESLIEGLFALRKAGFQGHPPLRPELDLVHLGDQKTHKQSLRDEINLKPDYALFKYDPDFLENEKRYQDLKKTVLAGCCSERQTSADLVSIEDFDALAKRFWGGDEE